MGFGQIISGELDKYRDGELFKEPIVRIRIDNADFVFRVKEYDDSYLIGETKDGSEYLINTDRIATFRDVTGQPGFDWPRKQNGELSNIKGPSGGGTSGTGSDTRATTTIMGAIEFPKGQER